MSTILNMPLCLKPGYNLINYGLKPGVNRVICAARIEMGKLNLQIMPQMWQIMS